MSTISPKGLRVSSLRGILFQNLWFLDWTLYLDSLEDYPDYPKIIEALVSGESGSEIPSGISSRD